MSGTPLNPARLVGLMSTMAKSFPLELLTDEVCKSWEDNAEELARQMVFLASKAPARKIKSRKKASKPSADTTHLRLLQRVELGPTSGAVTIAGSRDTFTGSLDSDYKAWGTNKPCQDTAGREALIYEMKADGNFQTLFTSINQDVRALLWQQGEIVLFCQTNRHLLRQDGYATFFLFEVDCQLFVAHVTVLSGELRTRVNRFENDYVFKAKYRHLVVVPEQTV